MDVMKITAVVCWVVGLGGVVTDMASPPSSLLLLIASTVNVALGTVIWIVRNRRAKVGEQ